LLHRYYAIISAPQRQPQVLVPSCAFPLLSQTQPAAAALDSAHSCWTCCIVIMLSYLLLNVNPMCLCPPALSPSFHTAAQHVHDSLGSLNPTDHRRPVQGVHKTTIQGALLQHTVESQFSWLPLLLLPLCYDPLAHPSTRRAPLTHHHLPPVGALLTLSAAAVASGPAASVCCCSAPATDTPLLGCLALDI
jgi:hypothetical protein